MSVQRSSAARMSTDHDIRSYKRTCFSNYQQREHKHNTSSNVSALQLTKFNNLKLLLIGIG